MHQNLSLKFWNCFYSLLGGFDLNKASNWPLRGIKHTLWEGGVRGSAFIWSPLLETSSEVQKCGIMGIQDWLPTLYAAAGMILFLIFRNSKEFFFWELQFEKSLFHLLYAEISVIGRTELSIMECTDRNFCTPHYRKFLLKADETS